MDSDVFLRATKNCGRASHNGPTWPDLHFRKIPQATARIRGRPGVYKTDVSEIGKEEWDSREMGEFTKYVVVQIR